MAETVVWPFSAVPVTAGKVFGNVHIGGGANSKHEEGMGVMASLDGDAIWRLRFAIPPTLPSGTAKLRLVQISNVGGTQAAKVNPKWAGVAMDESPSGATLNAEGTQTLSLVIGDADDYKELVVILDADAGGVNVDEIIVMDLTFETTGWTLAVTSTWQAYIFWE